MFGDLLHGEGQCQKAGAGAAVLSGNRHPQHFRFSEDVEDVVGILAGLVYLRCSRRYPFPGYPSGCLSDETVSVGELVAGI